MPYLILTGGKQKISVKQRLADKIIEWKEDKNISKDKLVNVGTGDYIALSAIKGVMKDVDEMLNETSDEKKQERLNYIREWKEDVERFRVQNPEEKAKRMIKTGCFLLFKARGNKPNKIEGELYDDLMMTLIPYFEENPKEWWAGREAYQDKIPYGEILKSNVKGMKTIGELMACG